MSITNSWACDYYDVVSLNIEASIYQYFILAYYSTYIYLLLVSLFVATLLFFSNISVFRNMKISGLYCNHYFLQMLAQIGRGHYDSAHDLGQFLSLPSQPKITT